MNTQSGLTPGREVPRGECLLTDPKGSPLTAVSLGTAIVVVLHCQKTGTIGMGHIPFPDSGLEPQKGIERPCLFTDTALKHLVAQLKNCGCPMDASSTRVVLAGGAGIKNVSENLDIGSQNVQSAQTCLQELGLKISAQDVGLSRNRSVSVNPENGAVCISVPGKDDTCL
jgi:chemotaxis protein CheD